MPDSNEVGKTTGFRTEHELSGSLAVVTGAGGGIGKAIAMRLAESGANLALIDISAESAEATRVAVAELGRNATVYVADIAQSMSLDRLVATIEREMGPIGALANVAGIVQIKPLLDLSVEDWDTVLNTNLRGTFFMLQAVAARMVVRNLGAIVNISSVSGRSGRSDAAHYAASKAAIISITQSAALALAEHGIRVNAICPGLVPTSMWDQIDHQRAELYGLDAGEARRQFTAQIPLNRPATPQEIADVACYLLGSGASYVTGQAVNVCGGLVMN
jgi:NAD(P)-dependent dehydrogenase (short-subunit alcohol dehydrogenase family)